MALNASRHHRKNRSLDPLHGSSIVSCSTPRGITGKIAVYPLVAYTTAICAQRLAASQEKSRLKRVAAVIEVLVLNAANSDHCEH
jgi:hypothetical protein